jgi:uncharacterized SAM-binding protein YcdF (DUF218 family)
MIRSVAVFFLDPFNIFLLLLLISAATYYSGRQKLFRGFFLVSMIWILIASTSLIPQNLLLSLEQQYFPLTEEEAKHFDGDVNIVVLGGGHGFNENLPANSLLSLQALARLNEGVRLHRLIPGSKLVLSGYSATGRTTQAEMLGYAADNIGIDREKIILQNEPANTFEEARNYANRYGNQNRVILVTSAVHMPRAAMLFEKCGVEFTASPAHYRIWSPERRKAWWPMQRNMEYMKKSLNEYVGSLRDGVREC